MRRRRRMQRDRAGAARRREHLHREYDGAVVLRRPGAVVLEIDDEGPDLTHLRARPRYGTTAGQDRPGRQGQRAQFGHRRQLLVACYRSGAMAQLAARLFASSRSVQLLAHHQSVAIGSLVGRAAGRG